MRAKFFGNRRRDGAEWWGERVGGVLVVAVLVALMTVESWPRWLLVVAGLAVWGLFGVMWVGGRIFRE